MAEELTEKFEGLGRRGCVLVNYRGLKGQDSADVRRLLSARGARMTVVRNAVFVLALGRLGVPELKEAVAGPTAVIIGEDPLHAAQAAAEAVRNCEGLEVVGGYAEGQVLDRAGVEELARLPGREALLSQTLSCMCAPAQRLVNVLVAVMFRLVSVLDQLSKKKEQQGADQA